MHSRLNHCENHTRDRSAVVQIISEHIRLSVSVVFLYALQTIACFLGVMSEVIWCWLDLIVVIYHSRNGSCRLRQWTHV